MKTDMSVANTILAQLGGSKFTAMTGAHSFCGDKNSLTMTLPSKRGQRVKITLDPNDTYTLAVFKVTGSFSSVEGIKVVEAFKRSDVYCDNLQEVFSEATGLHTSLGIPTPKDASEDRGPGVPKP